MCVKDVTLNSLPYIVGVAGLVIAVHEVAPAFKPFPLLSGTSTATATFSGQIVNRSLKSDRLAIEQAPPQVGKQIKAPAPSPPVFKAGPTPSIVI